MDTPNLETTLIIAEEGSSFEGWVDHLWGRGQLTLAAVQRSGESISAFAQRVRAKVAEPPRVVRAILVGGGRCDQEALVARSLVIRAVAAHMAGAGGGELLLEPRDGRDRLAMQALADAAATMMQGSGVTIRGIDKREPSFAAVA